MRKLPQDDLWPTPSEREGKKDEETTPALENLIVQLRLQLPHLKLQSIVRERFSKELRSRTYALILS